MSCMNELMPTLLTLQALEYNETTEKALGTKREDLRAKIPPPILGHYDRLIARGKKGVAVVRNQVCTGCHMRLPIGTINTLMQGTDVQLCDTCGRYLYLPDATTNPLVETAAAVKPASKPAPKTRKRKALAHTPA
jgi:predicted  nucleic acid-binding Zn-ribbon protein